MNEGKEGKYDLSDNNLLEWRAQNKRGNKVIQEKGMDTDSKYYKTNGISLDNFKEKPEEKIIGNRADSKDKWRDENQRNRRQGIDGHISTKRELRLKLRTNLDEWA